ncbi:hypothetical protein HPP92_010993 [Vanilla planifolia]|uniref:2-isopropylmalate synthase n=1 Tax=Vanilla planifolia TaxID=51239 RepID=A0A835R673_VANPL|nr:hypothetical protein HPP92_010993 [Vanilla planifolia]
MAMSSAAICFRCSIPDPAFSAAAAISRPCSVLLNARGLATCRPVRCCAVRRSLSSRPEYIPNRIPDPGYVRIFDTTLRDGEQSPGATMTSEEKLAIARMLSRLGVDVIEAGFPASSPDDLEAVRSIAIEVGNSPADDGHVPVICALARCSKKDIDAAWEAVRWAQRPRVHTFIATSEIHMEHKLRKTKEEVVRMAREMVAYARSIGCPDIEFSPEDAGRSDRRFLYHVVEEVIKAGATTVNIPDTVGYTLPHEFGQLIFDIKTNVEGIEDVVISTHCQNDLGLATANTLEGALAGARQLEVTVNGIGERAGNASLEEVVMAIRSRNEMMKGLYTGINTKHIAMASKLVVDYSGLSIQPHKPVVGSQAFTYGSGVQQDAMLKFKGTYDIMSPEDIGLSQSNETGIVIGKHSDRQAFKLGYDISGKELDEVFKRYKDIADRKKHVSDDEIEALVANSILQPNAIWSLSDLQVTCGTLGMSTVTVKLIDSEGLEKVACAVGTGPVHAAYEAVNTIVQVPVTLLEYSLNSVTEGIDTIATTQMLLSGDGEGIKTTNALTRETLQRTFSGSGADMDVVVSGVRAYIGALNKMMCFNKRSFNDKLKAKPFVA